LRSFGLNFLCPLTLTSGNDLAITLKSQKEILKKTEGMPMIRTSPLIRPPSWATSGIGKDACGIYADRDFGGVIQRFRFMPTGIFLYGNPGLYIPPGTIVSGGGGPSENQTREYIRAPFWLADTPVTQALWEKKGRENKSEWKNPKYPIANVSFQEANEFAQELGCRLPGERVWEYAAYGADRPKPWYEEGSSVIENFAWTRNNSGGSLRPVQTRWSNPCGLFDMLGNVAEWCHPYSRPNVREEPWPFVLRGGWFCSYPEDLKPWVRKSVVTRESDHSGDAAVYSGLRLCCLHTEEE
jgi:formylglycine-generating enzyme required for sulfatase activity